MKDEMKLTRIDHHFFEISNEDLIQLQTESLILRKSEPGVDTEIWIALTSNMWTCPCCGDRTPKNEPCECAYDTCPGTCYDLGLYGRGKREQHGQYLMVTVGYHFGSSNETYTFWKSHYRVRPNGLVQDVMTLWQAFKWRWSKKPRVKFNTSHSDEERILRSGFTQQEMDFFWASLTD